MGYLCWLRRSFVLSKLGIICKTYDHAAEVMNQQNAASTPRAASSFARCIWHSFYCPFNCIPWHRSPLRGTVHPAARLCSSIKHLSILDRPVKEEQPLRQAGAGDVLMDWGVEVFRMLGFRAERLTCFRGLG
jgi:hypothetical protein